MQIIGKLLRSRALSKNARETERVGSYLGKNYGERERERERINSIRIDRATISNEITN